MTVSEQKKQLRAQVRAAERSLSREERAQSNRLIVTHVLSLPEYQAARSLFCFVGTSREIDTTAILQDALRRGTILCVPLCTSPGKMELRRIQDLEQLRPGAYGILEPVPNTTRLDLSCVELSIIPCISCDHLGHRLGQGGGYYDRLFPPGRTGAFCCAGKPWSGSQSPVRLTMWCFPWSSPRPAYIVPVKQVTAAPLFDPFLPIKNNTSKGKIKLLPVNGMLTAWGWNTTSTMFEAGTCPALK